MKNYLVSNVIDRQHHKIYNELGSTAFFDLSPSQHGWTDFANIEAGDTVYVINKNNNVAVGFEVSETIDNILLEEHVVLTHKLKSKFGGDVRVIFGKPIIRVDEEYSVFVKRNKISNAKLNPATGHMHQGFCCASF